MEHFLAHDVLTRRASGGRSLNRKLLNAMVELIVDVEISILVKSQISDIIELICGYS